MEDTGRHLDFVLKHYRKGALDTRRAIRRFNAATSSRAGRRNPAQSPSGPDAGRRKVRTLWLSVISSAAAVAAGVIVYMNTGSRAWTENATAGAVQVCILPDSTSVTLAPGSSVCYRKGRAFLRHRKVKLEGMAFFRVTKDAAHPFVVSSENAYVKVLGTEFQVEEIPGTGNTTCTEVSVRSGKVFFSRTPESKGLVLVRDMSASLGPGETIPVLTNHAPNPEAWATGVFDYEDTPLDVVLDELSGYYGVTLTLEKGKPDRHLTGSFDAGDLDETIFLIEDALDVEISKGQE